MSMSCHRDKNKISEVLSKRLSRAKVQILQSLGKSKKTIDPDFDTCLKTFVTQQNKIRSYEKDVKNYYRHLQYMRTTSNSVLEAIWVLYDPTWTDSDDEIQVKADVLERMWKEYALTFKTNVVDHVDRYAGKMGDLCSKVQKRGRKMLDFDLARHKLEVVENSKHWNFTKLDKAREKVLITRNVYECINAELMEELPKFCDARLQFVGQHFHNYFASQFTFHSSASQIFNQLHVALDSFNEKHKIGLTEHLFPGFTSFTNTTSSNDDRDTRTTTGETVSDYEETDTDSSIEPHAERQNAVETPDSKGAIRPIIPAVNVIDDGTDHTPKSGNFETTSAASMNSGSVPNDTFSFTEPENNLASGSISFEESIKREQEIEEICRLVLESILDEIEDMYDIGEKKCDLHYQLNLPPPPVVCFLSGRDQSQMYDVLYESSGESMQIHSDGSVEKQELLGTDNPFMELLEAKLPVNASISERSSSPELNTTIEERVSNECSSIFSSSLTKLDGYAEHGSVDTPPDGTSELIFKAKIMDTSSQTQEGDDVSMTSGDIICNDSQ